VLIEGAYYFVRAGRVELPRSFDHQDLNLARLPISPHPQGQQLRQFIVFVAAKSPSVPNNQLKVVPVACHDSVDPTLDIVETKIVVLWGVVDILFAVLETIIKYKFEIAHGFLSRRRKSSCANQ
jgi:hypothetical protein